MFGLLRSMRRRSKAKPMPDKISKVIVAASGLPLFLKDDERNLIPKDEFVQAYIYGAISCGIKAFEPQDQETKGYILGETFEQLFPGKGADLLDACNQKMEALYQGQSQNRPAEAGDNEFKRVALIGLTEMVQVLETMDSGGMKVKILEGLRSRLVRLP